MVKKFLLIFALFIGVVVAMTMNSESDWLTGIGRRAPALNLRDSGRALNLDSLRGEYVILNFWTSTDAASRVAANEYDAWVEDHPRARVAFRSVNFDRSEGLYREIVRRDGLDAATQFHADSAQAVVIRKNYALRDGYGTLLINPQGKIIAHNPTPAQLRKILG